MRDREINSARGFCNATLGFIIRVSLRKAAVMEKLIGGKIKSGLFRGENGVGC